MIKNKNISIYIYLITLLHIISLLLCCPENCSNCDQDLKCKSCDSNYYLNIYDDIVRLLSLNSNVIISHSSNDEKHPNYLQF